MDGAQEGGPEQVAKLLPLREREMKYIALAFLLITLPVKAKELEIPVICEKTERVLSIIKEEYGEELIFLSEGTAQSNKSPLYHSLWVNTKTLTWSFLVVNKDAGTTCVFASGQPFQFYEPGESI